MLCIHSRMVISNTTKFMWCKVIINKVTLKDYFPVFLINNILEISLVMLCVYSQMVNLDTIKFMWCKAIDIKRRLPHRGDIYLFSDAFWIMYALATFQRTMTYMFSNLLHKSMPVLFDDFCVHGPKESHFEDLWASFERCQKYRVSFNLRRPFCLYYGVFY